MFQHLVNWLWASEPVQDPTPSLFESELQAAKQGLSPVPSTSPRPPTLLSDVLGTRDRLKPTPPTPRPNCYPVRHPVLRQITAGDFNLRKARGEEAGVT